MSIPKELPFEQVSAVALGQYPALLFSWFPNGTLVDGNKEFAIGDLAGTAGGKDGGSVKVNIRTGFWQEMNGGEPKGKDAISLYAWAFCGGDRTRACKEMGASLGVPGCHPPKGADVVPFPVKNPPRTPPKDDWQPCDPPDNAEPANTKGWDHVFIYRDRAGKLLRYVLRNDAKGNEPKLIRPLTYGTLKGKAGWHYKQPASPRCLYGLERLDNAPVILQEGELKTDQVQALLPGYACLSLTGGTGGRNHNDLAPLEGRVVILVPDNDAGGRDAMREIARQLRKLGAAVKLIDLTGQPDKWDLGDAVKEGWDAPKLEAFLKERAVDELPDPESGDDLEGEDPDAEWKEDGGERDKRSMAPIPLGYDKDVHYYLSPMKRQIVALTPGAHTAQTLCHLADLYGYWYRRDDLKTEKGKINWTEAAAQLMSLCSDVGVYQPDRARGRGAWMDRGRAVLNLGESLIVDGVYQDSLRLPNTWHVYEAAARLNQVVADPVRNAQAHKLLKMCELLRWERPISAVLAAGWIAVAPICGALHWRPSIWVTGGSSSGKTTFLRDIISPVLGGIAVPVQSKTTEAGLRQTLNTDARPVIFDEAEAEMLADKLRMQAVIDLVRQSSSEGGADIVKGTQSQTGAKRYRIRSCFLFSSINVALDHLADESRITVLDLYNPGPDEMDLDQKRWAELCAIMAETVADQMWCAGMVARSVRLMHVIRANAETFKLAVLEVMHSSRIGDQLGTLLAGAYSLTSDREITLGEARAYITKHDWNATTSADAAKDEQRLTSRLMQQRMKVDLGNKVIERTVSQVVEEAAKDTGTDGMADSVSRFYQTALKENGLKYEDGGVWVSNTHNTIKTWLKDSPWSSQWGRALKRLPGAKSSEPKTIAFGTYDKTKAVWVPLKALEG